MSFTYDIFLVAALWFLFGFIFLGLYKLVFSENDYFPPPIGALIIFLTTAGYYMYFWSNEQHSIWEERHSISHVSYMPEE